MVLKYAEYVFVFYTHKIKPYQILSVKTVKISYIKNAYKIGLNPQIKANVLYAKQITFKILLIIYIL